MNNTNVIVKCYGTEKNYTREKAIAEFSIAVQYCEGAEKERYANILSDLICGLDYCTDGQ